ncbi:nucleophile aminohydrolase [Nemania sp. FL0916]|nr:nucleophile aminohydrolase [Nemania sp. FL0916]
MADQSWLAPSGDHPPQVRAYYEQVRSMMEKSNNERAEASTATEVPPAFQPNLPVAPNHSLPNMANNGRGGLLKHTLDDDDRVFTDGTADRLNKRWKKPVTAIFVHAGAGYHSLSNEENHLKACSEACRRSMKVLQGGCTAVEAVEAAIKYLENHEITNAGYGSNLTIDGKVECDATIVDHLGRSGACGAVPNVKNPITLARAILENSLKPMSLRRVPPNLLVGEGAKEFAENAGVKTVMNAQLISINSRDRFLRWKEDLKRTETQEGSPTPSGSDIPSPSLVRGAEKEHTNAILTGTWNEGQPDSPSGASPRLTPQQTGTPISAGSPPTATTQNSPKRTPQRSPLSFLGTPVPQEQQQPLPGHKDEHMADYAADTGPTPDSGVNKTPTRTPSYPAPHDGASDERDATVSDVSRPCAWRGLRGPIMAHSKLDDPFVDSDDVDRITDTVGAIAVDHLGEMAAGSSSGGIGMKHRGRVGPAALVGVGTAVIPADIDDNSVAAVTSGTGEHMATTMAAQRCADRLYQGAERGFDGKDIPVEDETSILGKFIAHDFVAHPSVAGSTSPGAIGTMAVKKSPRGYYLYFAHNTESFALASMASTDPAPACVMSRNCGGDSIAQGGRRIRA